MSRRRAPTDYTFRKMRVLCPNAHPLGQVIEQRGRSRVTDSKNRPSPWLEVVSGRVIGKCPECRRLFSAPLPGDEWGDTLVLR